MIEIHGYIIDPYNELPMSELIGKSFDEVFIPDDKSCIVFVGEQSYAMLHIQDCCETVVLEDICGDIDWLKSTPILQSVEHSHYPPKDEELGDHETWSFYHVSTIKGTVTFRWYGHSNGGYYSEKASLVRAKKQ